MKNFKNEKAVSPVIGVILMVVITVIIAAILAVFAFGIGAPAKAPETQLKYVVTATGANPWVNVTNTGGDSLILKNENLTISNAATNQVLYGKTMDLVYVGNTYLAPGITLSTNGAALTAIPVRGDIIEIQVLDVPTGQMVSDAKVTVQ